MSSSDDLRPASALPAPTLPAPAEDETVGARPNEPVSPPAEGCPDAPSAGEPAPPAPQAELVATAPTESVADGAEPTAASTEAAVEPPPPGMAVPVPAEPAELPPLGAGTVAAEPSQEMGFSESTLLWLVDGDKEMELRDDDPATGPLYDPSLASAGRLRTLVLLGSAGIVALIAALALHGLAAHHRVPSAASGEPAGALIQRAEGTP